MDTSASGEEEEEEKEKEGEEKEFGWDEKRRGRRMSIGTRVLVDEGTAPGVSGRRAFPFFGHITIFGGLWPCPGVFLVLWLKSICTGAL